MVGGVEVGGDVFGGGVYVVVVCFVGDVDGIGLCQGGDEVMVELGGRIVVIWYFGYYC